MHEHCDDLLTSLPVRLYVTQVWRKFRRVNPDVGTEAVKPSGYGSRSVARSRCCDGIISTFYRSRIKFEFIMRQSQTDLKEKEWQYRNIFDAATDGLIIYDLETAMIKP